MKIKGARCDYAEERADDLMLKYRNHLYSCKHIRMPDVFKHIVSMPAKRFWVSSERASVVVCRMLRGDALKEMRKNKREMFQDIYSRFLLLRKKNPSVPISHLVSKVVQGPAPRFYLSPGSARLIILRHRKQWRKRHFQNLSH